MKKILLALTLLCFTIPSFAQKGIWSIGFDVGGGTAIDNILAYFEGDQNINVYQKLDGSQFKELQLIGNIMSHKRIAIQFGVSFKARYGVSNYYMIQPFASLWGGSIKNNEIQIGVDNVIFLRPIRKFRPYFIGGISFISLPMKVSNKLKINTYVYEQTESTEYNRIDTYSDYKEGTENISLNNIAIRGGLGLDARLSHHLSLQVEAMAIYIPSMRSTAINHMRGSNNYSIMNSYQFPLIGPRLKIGLMYNF